MSDTPRTDAENTYVVHGITHVSVHFARQLERELGQARRSTMKKKPYKYPKRTKEEFDAMFFIIRWIKKVGWIHAKEIIEGKERTAIQQE